MFIDIDMTEHPTCALYILSGEGEGKGEGDREWEGSICVGSSIVHCIL